MTVNFKAVLVIVLIGLSVIAAAQRDDLKYQNDYRWDFQKMCSMDDLGLWAGLRPDDLKISSDSKEGQGCLQAAVELSAGENLRLEHNFIDGFADVGAYLHGMNGFTEDFSGIQTVEFSYRSELNNPAPMAFMMWDRRQQWCQWPITLQAKTDGWKTVRLSIPGNIREIMDVAQTGGITFQITAPDSGLQGTVYLDDLKFLFESADGIASIAVAKPYSDYPRAIHSQPLPQDASDNPVKILMFCGINNYITEGNAEKAIEVLADSISRFRGLRNIEFWFYAGRCSFMDGQLTEEQIQLRQKVRQAAIKVAQWCEQNQVPFYMGAGHVTPILVKADWMKDILTAAPNYCKGMFLHEYSPESNQPLQEIIDLLELLREENKVLILNNQTSYWFTLMRPECTEFRNAMFNERYKGVFVPMWENLLPAAQGLCLGGVMGYWRAGLVENWGVSVQSWGYANLNYGLTDQMPADWWLRMLISSAALGAKYIEIEPDWPFNGHQLKAELKGDYLLKLDKNARYGQWQDTPEMKALRWFDDLLTHKTLLRAKNPDHQASLSPVILQAKASDNMGKTGLFERGLDIHFNQSHCPTHYEMSAQIGQNDIFRYVYRSNQHYDQTFPETPYGLITIVPMEARADKSTVFKTDGCRAFLDGQWKQPEQSVQIVAKAFADAASKLPFTAENCFITATKLSDKDYQVVMMDHHERFAAGVKTQLKIHLPGKWQVLDAITSAPLGDAKTIPVQIEPAYIRILRVQKQ